MNNVKRVAAIITEYRRHSHADVIVGKILEGFNYDGQERPNMRVVSMVVDQFPQRDMSRDLAKKFNFRIYDRIEDAITLGREGVNVDGVLIIGEHGTYPLNKYRQIMYPRRRFFEEATNVFARYKKSVPIFNDKHLSASWKDARWMYERARELSVPLLAGSSLPVTWRRPVLQLPRNVDLVEAVQIGYGPVEGYGFHALEALQCMVERRHGGEVGVRSVQCFNGAEIWQAQDRGAFSQDLLEAAMERVPAHANGDYRRLTSRSTEALAILVEYQDNFKAAMINMNGWVYEGDGGAFTFACRVKGQQKPLATQFYVQQPDPFAHFQYQVRAIDAMMQTNHAPYPVERTLLTTGILDAAMISRAEKSRRLATPHLAIRYTPVDYPFAQDPIPRPIKR